MVEIDSSVPMSIQRAIGEIARFPSCCKVVGPITAGAAGRVSVETYWSVTLPNRSRAKGISSTGVKSEEVIYWEFPADYPARAPKLLLREDFNPHFPHINPHLAGSKVPPCISDMPIEELLHSRGFEALLEATDEWLRRAASNDLQNPSQGWERVRRDSVHGLVLAETDKLRKSMNRKQKGGTYFKFRYIRSGDDFMGAMLLPELGDSNSVVTASKFGVEKETGVHHSIALMIWGDTVCGMYQSETIQDLEKLHTFAEQLGVAEALSFRLRHVAQLIWAYAKNWSQLQNVVDVAIVFAARRPYRLIGTDTPIELIPYILRISFTERGEISEKSQVVPVQLADLCSPEMLRKVSGYEAYPLKKIAILGCGSVGSKIALHLAKSGLTALQLVDNDYLSPHNYARHGLIGGGLPGQKAVMLKNEIDLLGVSCKAICRDIRDLHQPKEFCIDSSTDYVIDCSGSLSVRHFLAHSCVSFPGRLVHAGLFGRSTMGILAIEGKQRTVRVDDLIAFLYQKSLTSVEIRNALFDEHAFDSHNFGEGCGSYTMQIPDSRLSLLTASMASHIEREIIHGIGEEGGSILIGTLNQVTLSLVWEKVCLSATTLLPKEAAPGWQVRVLSDVVQEIKEESAQYPQTESGGGLLGHVCRLSNTIYVTGLVKAPSDSVRSVDKFILGTDGLADYVIDVARKTHGQLSFVGTWHSHTEPTPPSLLDKKSLEMLRQNSDVPVVMLVFTGGRIESVVV